jgi:hypothetical protein
LSALVVSLTLVGCTNTETELMPRNTEALATKTQTRIPSESNRGKIQSGLNGSIKVENSDADTNITYTFKNQSGKELTVVGGASYKLLKDNKLMEEGGVPVKDYIDLMPGEQYTDKKTFANLESGSYTIQVEWDNTIVSTEFVRK